MFNDIKWTNAGHNNWCSVGLTPAQFYFRVNEPAKKTFSNFDEACDYNTQCLLNDYSDKKYYLALSGGLDSELVADNFLKLGVKFTPIILKLGSSNSAETWYAEYWCYKNKIEPIVFDFSVTDIEQKFIPYLGKMRHTKQPGHIMFFWLLDFVNSQDGYLITGLGDINWDQKNNTFYNHIIDWTNELYLGYDHPCGWFSYTPEIAASFVKQFDPTLNEQYNKFNFYNVPIRQKTILIENFWNRSPYLERAYGIWVNSKSDAKRNEFGNKEETLFKLTGKYD